MQKLHPDDEALFLYAEAPDAVARRAEIEAHLDECDRCRTNVQDFRLLAAEMRIAESWDTTLDMTFDEAERLDELLRFEERLHREDVHASRLLAEELASPFLFHLESFLERPHVQTGGVVRLLCRRANEECDNEPLFALSLAEAATEIAARLPDDYYPADSMYELRGTAWKEYATACRYLGRYPAALEALRRAERAYLRLLKPDLSIATVELSRAIVRWRMEQYDDALQAAATAAGIFAGNGDTVRYLHSKDVEAVILHRKGDFEAARAAYLNLYEAGSSVGDPETMARAAQNLGTLFVERGDVGEASRYFLEALQLFEGMGQKARAARSRWCIGWVALVAGDFRGAERRLRASELEMRTLGVTDDADNVKLHLVEALLMLGRAEEVEILAAGLVLSFRAAGLVTGSLTAAAFLREAAAARTLTRRQVQHVREYLVRVKENPNLLFVPPPPPQ